MQERANKNRIDIYFINHSLRIMFRKDSYNNNII
jgi:hypothetical protein